MEVKQSTHGILEAYWEQGSEGLLWAVYDPAHDTEEGKRQLSGLQLLENGDYLRVFNDKAGSAVLWEGTVNLDYQRNQIAHPFFKEVKSQRIEGDRVNGIPANVEPSTWLHMFLKEKPCEVIKAAGVIPAP